MIFTSIGFSEKGSLFLASHERQRFLCSNLKEKEDVVNDMLGKLLFLAHIVKINKILS